MKTQILVFLMLLSMMFWGGTWVSAKILSVYLGSYELVFWRFLLSAFGLLPIIIFMKSSFKISLKNFAFAVVVALFLFINNNFFFLGVKYENASFGGVLVTTLIPINTFIIMSFLYKNKLLQIEKIALFIGALGTLTILNLWKFDYRVFLNEGIFYLLLASISWPFVAIFSSYIKGISVVVSSFYIYIIVSLLDFIFMLNFNIHNILNYDIKFWLNILIISVFGTSFATSVYFLATLNLGTKFASSFIFLVPLSAAVLSVVFLNEELNVTTMIGGGLTLCAVYIINFAKIKLKSNKSKG